MNTHEWNYVPPFELIERIAHWIAARAVDVLPASSQVPLAATIGGRNFLELTESASGSYMVREHPVCVAYPSDLVGIVSEPIDGTVRQVIVLLNVGIARRVGPSRMYVHWARHWAARGVAVLRLDLPGLGESASISGEIEGLVYEGTTIPAVAAAVEFLRGRYDQVECHLAGICSGAFHALRAAVAGVSVASLILINPGAYFWGPSERRTKRPFLRNVADAILQSDRNHVAATRNQSRVRALKLQTVMAAISGFSALRDGARFLGVKFRYDLGGEMRELAKRNVKLHFIFDQFDPAYPLLVVYAGRTVSVLQELAGLEVHVLRDADHVFTSRESREQLLILLDHLVFTNSAAELVRRTQQA